MKTWFFIAIFFLANNHSVYGCYRPLSLKTQLRSRFFFQLKFLWNIIAYVPVSFLGSPRRVTDTDSAIRFVSMFVSASRASLPLNSLLRSFCFCWKCQMLDTLCQGFCWPPHINVRYSLPSIMISLQILNSFVVFLAFFAFFCYCQFPPTSPQSAKQSRSSSAVCVSCAVCDSSFIDFLPRPPRTTSIRTFGRSSALSH